jgi:hypothetical protein
LCEEVVKDMRTPQQWAASEAPLLASLDSI